MWKIGIDESANINNSKTQGVFYRFSSLPRHIPADHCVGSSYIKEENKKETRRVKPRGLGLYTDFYHQKNPLDKVVNEIQCRTLQVARSETKLSPDAAVFSTKNSSKRDVQELQIEEKEKQYKHLTLSNQISEYEKHISNIKTMNLQTICINSDATAKESTFTHHVLLPDDKVNTLPPHVQTTCSNSDTTAKESTFTHHVLLPDDKVNTLPSHVQTTCSNSDTTAKGSAFTHHVVLSNDKVNILSSHLQTACSNSDTAAKGSAFTHHVVLPNDKVNILSSHVQTTCSNSDTTAKGSAFTHHVVSPDNKISTSLSATHTTGSHVINQEFKCKCPSGMSEDSLQVSSPNIYNCFSAHLQLSESFEAQLLAAIQKEDQDQEDQIHLSYGGNQQKVLFERQISDEESTTHSASFADLAYTCEAQEEMKKTRLPRLSDPLNSTDPQDWVEACSLLEARGRTCSHLEARKTLQNNQLKSGEKDTSEYLKVLFDPELDCYYDPRTGKYYEFL
ncbi:uncharacterized protein LOC143253546 isoform X2 [Tachypleus tridentatus]